MISIKRFFVIALTFLGVSTFAGNNLIAKGSFDTIKDVRKFNVEVDWSYLHVAGYLPADWIVFRNNQQPEYDAEKELNEELMPQWQYISEVANDKLNKKRVYFFPNSTDEEYTIIVTPHQIDKRGNMEGFCSIVNRQNELIVKFVLTGKGGRFGTMSNLWGDGFKSAGKNLANILQKYLLK